MDTKLLSARINDLFSLCEKHCQMKFSPFLDGGEAAFLEKEFYIPYGYNTMFYGGYDGAERKMLGVFPKWQQADKTEFPLSVIRFDVPSFRKVNHRDYLGTIMSLGIDRNKTGDILVDEAGAYIILSSDIAEYVQRNVTKIANTGVKTHIVTDFIPPEPKIKEKMCVCASLRLDAVVAAALNISRSTAEKIISTGGVKVNHCETADRAKSVDTGDLISVKNYGRFILKDTGNNTRKGRLHITVGKFL